MATPRTTASGKAARRSSGSACQPPSTATARAWRERLDALEFLPEFNLDRKHKDIDAVYIPEMHIDMDKEAKRLAKVMDEFDSVSIFVSEGACVQEIVAELEAKLERAEGALRVLRSGRVDPEGIVTHRFGLDAYADALAATAGAYDPTLHEAPLVVGHPELDAPAYGWVRSLRFAAGALEAEPYQVNPDNLLSKIVELHKQGRMHGIADIIDQSTSRMIAPGEAAAWQAVQLFLFSRAVGAPGLAAAGVASAGLGTTSRGTGEPEGRPMKVGVALVDVLAGLYCANGIQAALLHREPRAARGLHDVGAQCDVWLEPAAPGAAAADVFHARLTLPAP